MADRGFDIAESVAIMGANLLVPAYMKGKTQLSSDDVLKTRKIANVRIHVERVIGVVRQKYKILKGSIPIQYVMNADGNGMTTIDKIAKVCCALTNMNPSVVNFD